MTQIVEALFLAPHGRSELLWAQPVSGDEFRVLTVPIWVYGISVGTLVRCVVRDSTLHYVDLVEPAPGGTFRVMVHEEQIASQEYLNEFGPQLASAGVSVGPASFFDPSIVGVHFKNRAKVDLLRDILNGLEEAGRIDIWELGDPDTAESDENDFTAPVEASPPLKHDAPASARDRLWTFG